MKQQKLRPPSAHPFRQHQTRSCPQCALSSSCLQPGQMLQPFCSTPVPSGHQLTESWCLLAPRASGFSSPSELRDLALASAFRLPEANAGSHSLSPFLLHTQPPPDKAPLLAFALYNLQSFLRALAQATLTSRILTVLA